jgi:hypothetical protein
MSLFKHVETEIMVELYALYFKIIFQTDSKNIIPVRV